MNLLFRARGLLAVPQLLRQVVARPGEGLLLRAVCLSIYLSIYLSLFIYLAISLYLSLSLYIYIYYALSI